MPARPDSANRIADLRSRLPQPAIDLLDRRDGKYSEWATASGLAMHCLNAEVSEDEFVAVVSESDFAYDFATENGRDRSNRLESRLRKVWARAEADWNPPLSAGDVRQRLAHLLTTIERHSWTGRSSATDRKVAATLVSFGHELGKWTVDASTRDLSIRTGFGTSTISRSLVRLAEQGLIRRKPGTERGKATTWIINLAWARDIVDHTNLSPHRENSVSRYVPPTPVLVSGLSHPVFLRSALGPNAERLWDKLNTEGGSHTAAQLAVLAGMNVRTVRRNLRRLVGDGLVSESHGTPAEYEAAHATVDTLDRVASEYGVALDWEWQTAEAYSRQRDGYAEQVRQALARTQAAQTPAVAGVGAPL